MTNHAGIILRIIGTFYKRIRNYARIIGKHLISFDELKTELPQYLASAEGVSHEIDVIQLWKNHEPEIFSILTNSFSAQQESSIEDYVHLSVMLQYNYRC